MKNNNAYDAITNAVKTASKKTLTDQIKMSYEDIHDLVCLVESDEGKPVSADIVWAETMPLEHFTVIVEHPTESNLLSIEYRFDLFDDKIVTDDGLVYYGVMTVKLNTRNQGDIEICGPMVCTYKYLAESKIVAHVKYQGKTWPIDKVTPEWMDELRQRMLNALHVFYAVEVALLNPVIETVFVESSNTVPLEPTAKHTGKNKRAKIKYVKRHIIRMDAVNGALEKRGFVRHANLWYVTGHWREYGSGKKVFIKGYWKGALRSLKEVETRDREIVTA